MADYQTIEVPAGVRYDNANLESDLGISMRGSETLENVLFDVRNDGASISIRLWDNATVRNVGVKGAHNPPSASGGQDGVFRAGSGATDVTIDRLYAESFVKQGKGIGVTDSFSGRMTILGASIHGMPNNGLYASKAGGPITVRDCYFTNNRVANFRAGGRPGDPTHIFRNCVSVIDEGMDDVWNYPFAPGDRYTGGPGRGDRTWCFLGRHGTIDCEGCYALFMPSWDNPGAALGTDASSDCKYGGEVVWRDSEYAPDGSVGGGCHGNVTFEGVVGNDPATEAPPYAPLTPEAAASGETRGDLGSEPGTGRDTVDPTLDPSESNEFAIITPDGGELVTYTFEVDGEVATWSSDRTTPSGKPIESGGNDTIYAVDGRYVVEGETGNGYGDGYLIANGASVVAFDARGGAYSLWGNGETISEADLPWPGDSDEGAESAGLLPLALIIGAARRFRS